MRNFLFSIVVALAFSGAVRAETLPQVRLQTTLGDIVVALEADNAPLTVANFLDYVKSGFYDGTIFHRVIGNFMIQGGGFTKDLARKNTGRPIRNEADNGLENIRGTIAMARTGDPHSATSQFFINVVDNAGLNHKSPTREGWGYAVFGRVVEGMDVVDEIRRVPTTTKNYLRDVPMTPVVIERAVVEPLEN